MEINVFLQILPLDEKYNFCHCYDLTNTAFENVCSQLSTTGLNQPWHQQKNTHKPLITVHSHCSY